MPRYIDLDKLFEVPEGRWCSDFEDVVTCAIYDDESSLVKEYLNNFPSTEKPEISKVYAVYSEGCTYDHDWGEDDYSKYLFVLCDSKEVANSCVKDIASDFLKKQAHDGDIWEYEVTNKSGLLGVEATGGFGGSMTFYATELTVLKNAVNAELPTSEELNAIRSKEEEDYDREIEDYIREMDAKMACKND